jgi:hypothetical protein
LNEQVIVQTTEQNRTMAGRMMLGVLLLGTCGAAAGLLAGYGIARGINRSVVQLSVPIRDAAGKLNEVVGPLTPPASGDFRALEVSLQKVVERLHHSQREVLRSEQLAAVGQMAAGLAHELRNPLMSMKVLVQPAAERDASVSLSEEDLAVLNEEITRLDRSIQAFLDFARPPQLEKRTFEVRGVVEQAVHLVSGRAEQQGVRSECELPENRGSTKRRAPSLTASSWGRCFITSKVIRSGRANSWACRAIRSGPSSARWAWPSRSICSRNLTRMTRNCPRPNYREQANKPHDTCTAWKGGSGALCRKWQSVKDLWGVGQPSTAAEPHSGWRSEEGPFFPRFSGDRRFHTSHFLGSWAAIATVLTALTAHRPVGRQTRTT